LPASPLSQWSLASSSRTAGCLQFLELFDSQVECHLCIAVDSPNATSDIMFCQKSLSIRFRENNGDLSE
jgi:hypothetical protein